MEQIKRFKLYKNGKKWAIMFLAFGTIIATSIVGSIFVNADSLSDAAQYSVNSSSDGQTTSQSTVENELPDKSASANSNDSDIDVSNNNAVTVDSTAASIVSQNSSPSTTVARPNVTAADSKNQGSLDCASINNKTLNVSGWHATNYAEGRDNSFIILFDTTDKLEITRTKVDYEIREDVRAAFPDLNNAELSGFNTSFNFTPEMVGKKIQIISRYSSDEFGNSDYVDYWFAPIVFNETEGSLDKVEAETNGEGIVVSGWHATDLSVGKDNHYLILFNKSTGKQVSQSVSVPTRRNDIKLLFPGIYNENNSGFDATLSLNGVNITDDLSLISRYSNSASGNGGKGVYTEIWFDLPKYTERNEGSLGNFSFNGGTTLNASGWHATNKSVGKSNHYVILFDDSMKKEVQSIKVKSTERQDVEKAYGDIINARLSGFSVSFDFDSSLIGHKLLIVDRYSNSKFGNGGTGRYVDYWFQSKSFDKDAYSIDHYSATVTSIHLDGWFATNQSENKQYPYLIVINKSTGKEVARQSFTFTTRGDVGQVFSDIYGSINSGFSINIPINAGMSGENLTFILRVSSDKTGNSNYYQLMTDSYATKSQNEGSLDTLYVNNTKINISGWNAADGSYLKKYHYIILWDATNNREVSRVLVSNGQRQDVKMTYQNIYDSVNSGFSTSFELSGGENRLLRVVSRYSDNISGQGNNVDYWFAQTYVMGSEDLKTNEFYYANNCVYYVGGKGAINTGNYVVGKTTMYSDGNGKIYGVRNDGAPALAQRPSLPTGCEIVAVTMMLQYAGVNVSQTQIANEMSYSSDPNRGFDGNPYGTASGWVLASGIASEVSRYLGSSQIMSGASIAEIQAKLRVGHLVAVWMGNMNGFSEHCLSLTGYDQNSLFYNNPWTGQRESMSYNYFSSHWSMIWSNALSY